MADLWYPEILQKEPTAFPASVLFAFYDRTSTMDSAIKDTVHLYMPEQFGQPSTVSWDTFQGTEAIKSGMSNLPNMMRWSLV